MYLSNIQHLGLSDQGQGVQECSTDYQPNIN